MAVALLDKGQQGPQGVRLEQTWWQPRAVVIRHGTRVSGSKATFDLARPDT